MSRHVTTFPDGMTRAQTLPRFFFLAVGLAVSSPAFAQAPDAGAPVRINGSTTVYTNLYEKQRDRISREAAQPITVISNGSRQGLSDLAAGKCDIAMISATLDELIPRLTEAEKAQLDSANLTVSPLPETHLIFIVNEQNPVRNLTLAQVSDLFTGAITNWKEVGGPDLPVQIVSNQFSSGQRAVLEEKVTGGKKVVATAKSVANDPMIPGIVRQLKGALGHSGLKNDLRGVALVKTDKSVSQPMLLVTRGKPSGASARVIAASQKVAASTN